MNDDIFSQSVAAKQKAKPHIVAIGERKFDLAFPFAQRQSRQDDNAFLTDPV